MSALIEFDHVCKYYQMGDTLVKAADHISMQINKGEFVAIVGTSGSGKSTLLNIIGGIDSADAGFISIGGDELEDMGEKALTQYRRKHLGYVFQLYNLIANLNVKENIEVGAYLSDAPLDIDEDNVATVITECDITKMADQLNHSMGSYSGWFAFHMEPAGYVKMFVFVLLGYAIVTIFDFRRIRKIPMDEALKSAE